MGKLKTKFDSNDLALKHHNGHWFELDGKRMIEGDWQVQVTWPDGKRGRARLFYKRGTMTIPHGTGPADLLFLEIWHHDEALYLDWVPSASDRNTTSFTWEMSDAEAQALAKNDR